MSNSIFSLLQQCSQEKDGVYDGLHFRTKSGAEHKGTLVHWNPMTASNLICITGDMGRKTYLDRDSIESLTISNPAR